MLYIAWYGAPIKATLRLFHIEFADNGSGGSYQEDCSDRVTHTVVTIRMFAGEVMILLFILFAVITFSC